MFPSIQQIEEVIESLEGVVYASLSAATPDMPGVRETFDRLWDDVSRFGPNLPDIHVRMPGLGDFHVPPPPPPPPPPKNVLDKLVDWCQENPWIVLGVGLGAGLLVGYGSHKYRVHRGQRVRHISTTSTSRERRQVVGASLISFLSITQAEGRYRPVVLGGDRPIGLPLILDLEKKGYIVITSVESSAAVESIESKTHGYVRALVLESANVRLPPFQTPFSSLNFPQARFCPDLPSLACVQSLPQVPSQLRGRPTCVSILPTIHPIRHLPPNSLCSIRPCSHAARAPPT